MALFILFLAVITTKFSPSSWNDFSRLASIDSIIYFHVPWVDKSHYFGYGDIVFHQGHFYSDKMPMMTWYSAFIIYPLKYIVDFHSPLQQKLFYYLITLTASGLSACITYLLVFRSAKLLGLSVTDARRLSLMAICGTLLFPYIAVYNPMMIEAVLGLSIFYTLIVYRIKPLYYHGLVAGLLAGACFTVHPMSGILFSLMANVYFLFRRKLGQFLLCLGGVLIVISLFLAVHNKIYGQTVPLYFSPEKYFYIRNDGQLNTNISAPGLQREKLERRLEKLNISEELFRDTLNQFDIQKNKYKNPLAYMAELFYLSDYLVFTPLTIFCFILLLRYVFKSNVPFRLEILWAVLSMIIFYIAMVFLRAQPGQCFGNRYFIPVLPILFAASAATLSDKRVLAVFIIFFWASLPIILPGILSPWSYPPHFFKLNLIVSVVSFFILAPIIILDKYENQLYDKIVLLVKFKNITISAIFSIFFIEFLLYFMGRSVTKEEIIRFVLYAGVIPLYIYVLLRPQKRY